MTMTKSIDFLPDGERVHALFDGSSPNSDDLFFKIEGQRVRVSFYELILPRPLLNLTVGDFLNLKRDGDHVAVWAYR